SSAILTLYTSTLCLLINKFLSLSIVLTLPHVYVMNYLLGNSIFASNTFFFNFSNMFTLLTNKLRCFSFYFYTFFIFSYKLFIFFYIFFRWLNNTTFLLSEYVLF